MKKPKVSTPVDETATASTKNSSTKNTYSTVNGIEPPNYTQIPNIILDFLMAELSGAEFKVIMYICRRTFGFNKPKDSISLNQLVKGITKKDGVVLDLGTGLNKDTIVKAIHALEDRGLVEVKRNESKKTGFKPSTYTLNLSKIGVRAVIVAVDGSIEIQEALVGFSDKGVVGKSDKGLVRKIRQGVVGKSDIQEKAKQETELQKTVNTTTTGEAIVEGPNEVDVVVALITFGVAKNVAEKWATIKEALYLQKKLDYAQYLLEYNPEKIKTPAGWLVKAIENDYAAPDGFVPLSELIEIERQQEIVAQQQEEFQLLEREKARRKAQLEKDNYMKWRERLTQEFGTTEDDFEQWKAAQTLLEQSFINSPASYSMFVQNAEILSITDDTVTIGIDSDRNREWLKQRNIVVFERDFHYLLQKTMQIEVIVIGRPDPVQEEFEFEDEVIEVNGYH